MNPFSYWRAQDVTGAVTEIAGAEHAKFIGGGTNLLDLMKYDIERPSKLIDINRLPMKQIQPMPDGGLRIGALVSNTAVAYDPQIERGYPLLAKAILAGASAQLRNMATVGGNLMQRTR
jgi:xanthine dehydrogenase YagS FAD-binding subunit